VAWTTLLSDLSDADLLVRPAPAANHLAWQLGHLISSERQETEAACPGVSPPLPEGFAEKHSQEQAKSNNESQFLSKQQYLDLYRRQREATLAAVETLDDADLEKPGPAYLQQIAPTVGATLALTGLHWAWHLGQVTALRRHLGKPVLI
jgi:hypothetical protein